MTRTTRCLRSTWQVTVRVVVVLSVLLPVAFAVAVALGQLRTTTLLTGSMSPELPAGTFVVERPVPARDVRPGDVITFTVPDGSELVTHRVVTTGRDERGRVVATTRGDANDRPDDWTVVLSGEPVWTASWHVTGVGELTTALRRQARPLAVAAVVLPLLLLTVTLRGIWRTGPEPVEDADADADLGLELLTAGAST